MIYTGLNHVLIDAVARYEREKSAAAQFGIDAELFDTAYGAAWISEDNHNLGGFQRSKLFEECDERLKKKFDPSVVDAWEKIWRKQFFFPETLEFLRRAGKQNITIVTVGVKDTEMRGVRTHGLEELVLDIVVLEKPDFKDMAFPKNSFFLDSSLRILKKVKSGHPQVQCVQVHTPAPWEPQVAKWRPDYACKNLLEALEYIRKNAAA